MVYLQIDANMKFYLSQYEYGEEKFAVLDFNLPINLAATFFAPHSPFKNKFVEMLNRVYEYELDKKWEEDFNVTMRIENNKNHDLTSNPIILVMILSIIMVIGVIISFVAFFFEVYWNSYLEKKIFADF